MKNSLSGLLLTCLLLFAGSAPGRAQDRKPDPQTSGQAAADSNDPQQTAPQQTPQADAGSQQTPPQTTPPQTTTPPQQQTPPVEATQQQRGRIPEPPPPPPKVPDVRRPGESGYFVGVMGWFPVQRTYFNSGRASQFIGSAEMTLPGKPKVSEGVEIGLAVGLHNMLRFSAFDSKAQGNTTVATDFVAWDHTYTAGTYVAERHDFRNYKLSYEFLTWPYPVGSRKFRLKTLWQLQYTSINTSFDAPKNYYDDQGNLLIDVTTGNPISNIGAGKHAIILPTLGLGAHYYWSRHVRFEANASGFAIPRRSTIWDADASLNMRMIGHLELRVGAKAYHFKTSTNNDFYMRGTLASAFFGLRWYSLSE